MSLSPSLHLLKLTLHLQQWLLKSHELLRAQH